MFQQERERADGYSLIAQLFAGPPDGAFLRSHGPRPPDPELKFTLHEPEDTGYDGALKRFQTACGEYTAERIAAEFGTLFGTLRHSISAPAAPHELALLRDHLQACGLASHPAVFAIESYVSSVCDVLRWLVEHDRPLNLQSAFFYEFVDQGVTAICDAIESASEAAFYREVAELARTFINAERNYFRI